MVEHYNFISSAYFLIHCWGPCHIETSSRNSKMNNQRFIYYLHKVKTWSLPFHFNPAHTFWSSRYFHALFSVRYLHCFKSVAEPSYCPWKLVKIIVSEAAAQRCFSKHLFLKISQNSQENASTGVSFVIEFQATLLKNTSAQVFLCNFCEIFKSTFFAEYLRPTTFKR